MSDLFCVLVLCLMSTVSSASLHLDIKTRLEKEPPVFQYICRTIATKLKEKEVFAMMLWGNPCPALRAVFDHVKDFPFHEISRPGETWKPLEDNLLSLSINNLADMYLLEQEYRSRKLSLGMPISPSPPIVILGLTSTGSTFLQTLLALDPDSRTPLTWEVIYLSSSRSFFLLTKPVFLQAHYPVGPPSVSERIRMAHKFDQLEPRPVGAELPEECHLIMHPALFPTCIQDMGIAQPGYAPIVRWSTSQSAKDSMYAYHRRVLQVLHSQGRSLSPKSHWVLKDPVHMPNLKSLLKTYPDARIVWTHRNILDVVRSDFGRRQMLDPKEYLEPRHTLEIFGRDATTGIRVRDSLPDAAARFCDVYFEDLVADPLAAVGAIYRHFGLQTSPAHVSAMEAWLSDNFRAARRYNVTAESLGFSSERAMLAPFEQYMARFPRTRP
jgi:hypothetical protein